tara:strand:- start:710 stop:1270 length:561 start_codon:yes stop_codon:yes gene_type:complete
MKNKHNIIETTTVKNNYGRDITRKKIKDEFFKDSNIISEAQSKLASQEDNDCVVRAFMMTLGLTYEKAHKFVETKFKRKAGKGTYTKLYLDNILNRQKNGYKMRLMGYHPTYSYGVKLKKLVNPTYKKETGYTVKSFMEQHQVGRYFIIVKGHALALVDGVLYGNSHEQYNGFRRTIHYVIQCKTT